MTRRPIVMVAGRDPTLVGGGHASYVIAHALAAARALLPMELDADEIVRRSMRIAADICVYTNTNLVLESL